MNTASERKRRFKDIGKAILIFVCMLGINVGCMLLRFRVGGAFDGGARVQHAVWSSTLALTLISFSLFSYIVYSRKKLLYKTRSVLAVCTSVCFGCFLNVVVSIANVYFMPIAITAFLLVPLVDKRDVVFANTITVLSTTVILFFEAFVHVSSGGADSANITPVILMMFLGVFTGSVVAYSMSNLSKRLNYVIRGAIISATHILIVFLFSLSTQEFEFTGQTLLFVSIASVGQVFGAIMLQPVLEKAFNLLTNTRLSELCDHNNPLIRRLIAEAPGTFNHSLAVASFAEVCALNIGENPYLAKACAYYHDIGKLSNPVYFSENQSRHNPHDELLPEVSAQIIRKHTMEGYELCTQYRIPEEIKHVTIQHHGTLPMAVFYEKAKKLTDGEVDMYEYSHHGQTPVTKIAAILMVCDAAEAAIRAMADPNAQDVERLLTGIINDRVARRQFDNCEITMRDLSVIRQTIMNLYGGMFHERVRYPDGKLYGHD